MGFLIAALTVIILSINASYIFNKKFEHTLPLTTAGISFVLYIFSFIEARPIGIYLLLMILVTSTAYSIYQTIHNHDWASKIFKSSGLVYFVVMVVCTYVITRGFTFTLWDEFSHWGLILKNMFLTNGFGNLGNSTTFSYPPGVSLFQSLFTHFSKSFNESNALGGILILSYSQLAILFAKVKYNRGNYKKIILILGILSTFPLIFFGNFYETIYVDAAMGLIFGNILYFNYLYREKDLFYTVYMSLQFYLLASTKQIGIGLALIAFVAIFVDFIHSNKAKSLKTFVLKTKKELIFTSIPLGVGILTNFSWGLYLKSHNISEILQSSSVKFSDPLNLLRGNILNHHKETIVNFSRYFFVNKRYGTIFLSYFWWSIILLLVLYCVYKTIKPNKQKTFTLQIFTFLGLFVYSGTILFTYLFVFSKYEAQNLASIDRYLGTYFLGLLMLSLFILIDHFIDSRHDHCSSTLKLTILLTLLLCIISVNNLTNATIFSSIANGDRQHRRAPYDDVKRYESLLNPKTDRVYIISQGSNGKDYWILGYNLTPVQVSPIFTWSLGMPYSSSDIWTVNKNVEEWSQDLKNYTYVYLYRIDHRFKQDYGQLFENPNEIKSKNMYRITKTDKKVNLKIVL